MDPRQKEDFGYLADNAAIRSVEQARLDPPEDDDSWTSAEDIETEMSDEKWNRLKEGI